MVSEKENGGVGGAEWWDVRVELLIYPTKAIKGISCPRKGLEGPEVAERGHCRTLQCALSLGGAGWVAVRGQRVGGGGGGGQGWQGAV